VEDRTFEQVGHGRQANVRMRPHIVVVLGPLLGRAEVVEEQEGADGLALGRRQQPAHGETAAQVFVVSVQQQFDGHARLLPRNRGSAPV